MAEEMAAGADGYAKLRLLHRSHTAIEAFFRRYGYLQVFTPILIRAPAPEPYIQAVSADEGGWLRTSPELHMKRLLAEYPAIEAIYQIGPCFRQEEWGRCHRTEFTMIEWYRKNVDYRHLESFTRELIGYLCDELELPVPETWQSMSVDEAFRRFADLSLDDAVAQNCYEEQMVTRVEPAFKEIPALFLYDFPASMAALAVIDESRTPPVAQRWELYLYGIEVANTYTELIDGEEHRQRFEEWNHYRQTHGLPVYPEDQEFLDAVAKLPPCAGCAMGLERLLMGLTRRDEISFFRLFPDEPRRPSIP